MNYCTLWGNKIVKVANYLVRELKKEGVKDVFGIPGGVVIKLLYAFEEEPDINAHLLSNETLAGYAACGYAEATEGLGVAYATRGPGILNMISCIAEAYQESLAVIFITAHNCIFEDEKVRFLNNQEINVADNVKNITKYSACINTVDEVTFKIKEAIEKAKSGRKGPVLLDFYAPIWNMEIEIKEYENKKIYNNEIEPNVKILIDTAKRPVILIGNGVRNKKNIDKLNEYVKEMGIPVVSSRGAQDILAGNEHYYGYIGSHGIRYANFIISKADLIISIGNRLAFPPESESFFPISNNTELIRVDIDRRELDYKRFSNSIDVCTDSYLFFEYLHKNKICLKNHEWKNCCDMLKKELSDCDCEVFFETIEKVISMSDSFCTFVCDVGNNEFWFSRCYEKVGRGRTVLISKSFGSLGCSIAKAIGVFYGTDKPVVCVVGDQGIQYGIVLLHYIVKHNLPIKIVLLNNKISGMIRDHECNVSDYYVHVNSNSGYFSLDTKKLCESFGFCYCNDVLEFQKSDKGLIEIEVPDEIKLNPRLPKGDCIQNMYPYLEKNTYDRLNRM